MDELWTAVIGFGRGNNNTGAGAITRRFAVRPEWEVEL